MREIICKLSGLDVAHCVPATYQSTPLGYTIAVSFAFLVHAVTIYAMGWVFNKYLFAGVADKYIWPPSHTVDKPVLVFLIHLAAVCGFALVVIKGL